MSNVLIWTEAIRNEDGEKLSLGSLRTLNLIDAQYKRQQNFKDDLFKALLNVHKYASDCSLDNVSQMSEALKWIIAEAEATIQT